MSISVWLTTKTKTAGWAANRKQDKQQPFSAGGERIAADFLICRPQTALAGPLAGTGPAGVPYDELEQVLRLQQRRRTLHANSGAGRLAGRETGALAGSRRKNRGETTMRLSQFALGVAVMAAASAAVATAHAENGIYIPLMSYRTGPYSGAGAAIFNGMSDYLNMLNARDGGVGGARLIVEECETGYDTKKGVECYDSTKGKSPVVSTPYSTGSHSN